jgi:hypothetical protein
VKATVGIVTLDPSIDVGEWLKLLLAFDLIYLVTCTLAFPYAVET